MRQIRDYREPVKALGEKDEVAACRDHTIEGTSEGDVDGRGKGGSEGFAVGGAVKVAVADRFHYVTALYRLRVVEIGYGTRHSQYPVESAR